MHLLFFDSQAAGLAANLRRLNQHSSSHTLLKSFFAKVDLVLREEHGQQSSSSQQQLPGFTTIFDLLERNVPDAASTNALQCTYHLATFIYHLEERPDTAFDWEKSCVVGIDAGSLAAAAVASSRSPLHLTTVAAEAVRVAFRTGLTINRASKQVEDDATYDQSWSILIENSTFSEVSAELHSFNSEKEISYPSRAYISAVTKDTITVSGSPSRLQQLVQESEFFKRSKATSPTTYGLYHAPHTYREDEAQGILQASETYLKGISPSNSLHSTATGSRFLAPSGYDLFYRVISEILQQPIRWDMVLEVLAPKLNHSTDSECILLADPTSLTSKRLVETLRTGTELNVQPQNLFEETPSPGRIPSRTTAKPQIAIVGMAGRFPGASGVEALWKILEEGLDVHRKVPADRFNVETHYDPTGKQLNTSHTPYGCFIEEPGLFDARFFNMSPREAAQTDPMHRLALLTAYEALEMSGFVANRTPSTRLSRVGTFYGQTSDDWREVNIAQKIDTFFIPGGVRAFAPGRINYFFKFGGPSYSIDTACSSSLAAIQVACSSIWQGECDTAVCGGLNVLTAPGIFAGLSRGQFLSKTGSCKTFDANADGYCRADGAGTVILKKLEDAEADNDNILGVILDTATNHSADAISITHPHAGAQSYLYQSVMNNTGIDPYDVDYVEMHGTGTQAGDKTEMESVLNVFAPRQRKVLRTPDQSLHLGAVKSNIGHGEAAAGVTALIKILLMLQKNMIPPHVGIKSGFNPALPQDLKARNVQISLEPVPWRPTTTKRRLAFLNNFSAAGGNTSLLLEDYQPLRSALPRKDPRPVHVVTVSAKSMQSMKGNLSQLISYLESNPNTSLADLSYTTSARRPHHNYRIALTTSNVQKLSSQLAELVPQKLSPVSSTPPKVAFVFTGQGSFYTSLGRRLYDESPRFRSDILHMESIALNDGLPSFLSAIDGSVSNASVLSPTITQLALCCIQMALSNMWISWGVIPSVVIGHSLGEYAALNTAGVLSLADTIHLVGQRAKLLEEKLTEGTHAMLAVKGSMSSIVSALSTSKSSYEISCINGPREVVITSAVEGIPPLQDALRAASLDSVKLNTPYAFHSSQVDHILSAFSRIASGAQFHTPKVPVVSSLLSRAIDEAGVFDADYLCRHARETVNFFGALQNARSSDIVDEKTVWVELGAHPVCSKMVQTIFVETIDVVPSLRKNEDPWVTLAESQRVLYSCGLKLKWSEVHREFGSPKLLQLPSYSFDYKNHWIDYVGDWCLMKGQVQAPIVQKAIAPPPKPKFSTTSIQQIMEENFEANTGSVVTQSDIQEPLLRATVMNHCVNGQGFCPSSLYGDIAYTIAGYLYSQLRPGSDRPAMDVCQVEVTKPLVARNDTSQPQIIQVSGNADLDQNTVQLRYASLDAAGSGITEHATCTVKYSDPDAWLSEWAQIAYLVRARIDALKSAVNTGSAVKLTRGLVYKLFSAIVEYGDAYKGLEEVILDNTALEATAKVRFQSSERDGNFFCSPYWIDSLGHLSGFVANGSDTTDSKKFVYISHGWKYLRFAKELSNTANYQTYVKMQQVGDTNMVAGDVYVFDGDTIVGVMGGLRFQRVPRPVLDILVPPDRSRKTVSQGAAKSVPTKPQSETARKPVTVANQTKTTQRPLPQAAPQQAKNQTKSVPGSLTVKALNIIAQEAEIELSEIQDECAFSDLGVDSLLSLSVAGKFREELDLDIPGSFFVDYPTVKSLKAFLRQAEGKSSTASQSDPHQYEPQEMIPPSTAADSSSDDEEPVTPATPADDDNILSIIQATIAEQMELAVEEISGSADLGELGVDSLMQISILGSLRETLDIPLPSSFLIDYPSMDAIEKYFKRQQSTKSIQPQSASLPSFSSPAPNAPPAVSTLLQGNRKTATKTLFIFPDGSGSASSYASIPDIAPDVCVYGLDCPFMKTPQDYTCGIEAVSTMYLQEVRRRQSTGPYYLSGWSAGGIVAYEVALQLQAMGERVERLILLDSPCPIRLPALPSRLHEFFGEIGLFGSGGKVPKWLLPHFEASIRNLTAYKPKPMDRRVAPKTFAIWAEDGVCKNPEDPRPVSTADDPKSMKWLLENRTDFGDNGWAPLLGLENIKTARVGANHFSLMKEPVVRQLAALIKQGLDL